ncbi:MAG: FtsL-like putative cell division protein [Bacteroidota bacterium]
MEKVSTNIKSAKKITATAVWNRWMHGQWIVRHVPFALFLSLLAILYIANGHYTDNTIRNIGNAQHELKQLQYRYKTLKAEVMYRSKESELSKAVEALGLKRLEEPPVKLVPVSTEK